MKGPICLMLAVALFLCGTLAFATPPSKEEMEILQNDFIKVTAIKETEQSEEKFVNDGSQAVLKQVPYKSVKIVAELLKKPPMGLDAVFSSQKKIPELRVCIYEKDELGNLARDGQCEMFLFDALVPGNIGTATFRLPLEMNSYGIKVADKQPNKSSTFKLWTPDKSTERK
ncbi:hypothetical protein [Desulfovibrio inopinatus]|uniref:hypothetical protein n=1 Tax=Desulfovibrio inopinatus TaxID=102109 RepID=UPI000687E13B|nr:hypothetical protein [Desulfovibrio inopinatus]